jgi:hypothetical protein
MTILVRQLTRTGMMTIYNRSTENRPRLVRSQTFATSMVTRQAGSVLTQYRSEASHAGF